MPARSWSRVSKMPYRLLYNLLIHLGLPLALLALYKPKKGKPGFGVRWAEHLGRTPASGQEAPLWIHAVSVGETLAISPFIRALKAEQPSLPILLTTTTRTGAEQAAKLGDLVVHRYAPLDYPWAVSAFLATFKPRALWVMETELWPNWLAACEARHLPVTILNARLSERSCQRYARFQGAFDALSRPLTHLLCQHQDDADRFHRLGIGRERLAVTGSIKFDIQFGDEVQARGRALRQQRLHLRRSWQGRHRAIAGGGERGGVCGRPPEPGGAGAATAAGFARLSAPVANRFGATAPN